MNLIVNITPSYEFNAIIVLRRLIELGDAIEKVLVLTNAEFNWGHLRAWAQESNVDIHFHVLNALKELTLKDRFDSIIYGRLFLNEPNFFNRGLYLDVDIWPRSGLGELWKCYTECPIYVVKDEDSVRQMRRLGSLGYKGLTTYFNAGVILFNDIQSLKFDFQCMQELISEDFKYHDQDILNVVLKKKIALLPEKYNHMTINFSDDAVLVHFAHSKPWFVPCFHQNGDDYMRSLESLTGKISRKRLSISRSIRLSVKRLFH